MDDAGLGRRPCRAWHTAVGPYARSGIDDRFNHAWQFAWPLSPGVPPEARHSFRSVDRHVCRVCRDPLDSLLHSAVVDVVRSHRRRNHVPDRRDRKSCGQRKRSSSSSEMSNGKKLELVRGLGPWTSAAIVVGTMIGTGIFLKPAEMAADAGSIVIVLAAWIAGGILSLFGALAFAELGAAIPEAGGEYAYLRRAFGPVWGFLFGWMHSIVGRPSSASSIAAGLVRFLGFLLPAVATPIFAWQISVPFLREPYVFVFTWAQPLAVVALVALTSINYLGVRVGGRVQVILTIIKVTSVAAIIVLAFALARPGGAGFHPFMPARYGAAALTGFFGALAASLWAYDGWEDLTLVGSEVADPQRNIPRALILGVLFCSVIFMLFSAASHWVLPFAEVARSEHVASDVVARICGRGAALWVTAAMAVSRSEEHTSEL